MSLEDVLWEMVRECDALAVCAGEHGVRRMRELVHSARAISTEPQQKPVFFPYNLTGDVDKGSVSTTGGQP